MKSLTFTRNNHITGERGGYVTILRLYNLKITHVRSCLLMVVVVGGGGSVNQ